MDKDQKKDARNKDLAGKQAENVHDQERIVQKNVKQDQQLTTEDLPDSNNESRGTMGSGQRQDDN
jgi:hypothetical protein